MIGAIWSNQPAKGPGTGTRGKETTFLSDRKRVRKKGGDGHLTPSSFLVFPSEDWS